MLTLLCLLLEPKSLVTVNTTGPGPDTQAAPGLGGVGGGTRIPWLETQIKGGQVNIGTYVGNLDLKPIFP